MASQSVQPFRLLDLPDELQEIVFFHYYSNAPIQITKGPARNTTLFSRYPAHQPQPPPDCSVVTLTKYSAPSSLFALERACRKLYQTAKFARSKVWPVWVQIRPRGWTKTEYDVLKDFLRFADYLSIRNSLRKLEVAVEIAAPNEGDRVWEEILDRCPQLNQLSLIDNQIVRNATQYTMVKQQWEQGLPSTFDTVVPAKLQHAYSRVIATLIRQGKSDDVEVIQTFFILTGRKGCRKLTL